MIKDKNILTVDDLIDYTDFSQKLQANLNKSNSSLQTKWKKVIL